MNRVSKISVTLTPELTDLVQQAVASGAYATGSEVIGEALREWKLRRDVPQHIRSEIRQLWDNGIASGPGRFEDIEAIKREARHRLEAGMSRLP